MIYVFFDVDGDAFTGNRISKTSFYAITHVNTSIKSCIYYDVRKIGLLNVYTFFMDESPNEIIDIEINNRVIRLLNKVFLKVYLQLIL